MNRGSSGFWRSSLLQFLTEAAAAPILSSCQNMLTLVLSPEPGATLLGALYALCRLYVEQQTRQRPLSGTDLTGRRNTLPFYLARWNGMQMEGHARTWVTPKPKAKP